MATESSTAFGDPRVQFFTGGISSANTLPSMSDVMQDAAQAPAARDSMQSSSVLAVTLTANGTMKPICDSLSLHGLLPRLFWWSFLVHVDDVPENLLADCIWSLEVFIQALEQSTRAQLRSTGIIAGPNSANVLRFKSTKEIMIINMKIKISIHLLKPTINRPACAIPHMRYVVEYSKQTSTGVVFENPQLIVTLAEALIRSGEDLKEAKKLLKNQIKSSSATFDLIVRSKIWLARLLRIEEKHEEAQEIERWLIKWFQKNPHLLPERRISELLMPGGGASSPVLEALGGIAWIEERETTDKIELRRAKNCHQCGARPPLVKLFVCSKCLTTHFCSKECQKKNWPFHKNICRDQETLNETLSLASPQDAQREKAFHTWLRVYDKTPMYSALGLHRDAQRGRTHIMIQEVFYTPKASKEARDKFRVLRCGVFRVADTQHAIEQMMNIDPGEGQEYVDGLLREMDAGEHAADRIPYVFLSFGKGLMPYLAGGTVWLLALQERVPYNAEWRSLLNSQVPPIMLQLQDKLVQDAEHDF